MAVLLPCHNEEAASAGVIESFNHALPEATVYAYDIARGRYETKRLEYQRYVSICSKHQANTLYHTRTDQ